MYGSGARLSVKGNPVKIGNAPGAVTGDEHRNLDDPCPRVIPVLRDIDAKAGGRSWGKATAG